MPALRCTICGESWPVDEDFERCPSPNCVDEDGEQLETDYVSNIKPTMSFHEAQRLKSNYDFERFYESWDASHDPKRLEPTSVQEGSEVP